MIKNNLIKLLSIIGRSIKIIKLNSRIRQWKIPEQTPYDRFINEEIEDSYKYVAFLQSQAAVIVNTMQ